MKDEMNGYIIQEAIFLRLKKYLYKDNKKLKLLYLLGFKEIIYLFPKKLKFNYLKVLLFIKLLKTDFINHLMI
jgi:hypothetical protein